MTILCQHAVTFMECLSANHPSQIIVACVNFNSDRYTGNQGDSFVNVLGSRNGFYDVNGNLLSRGLEAWLARWNGKDETSWAWCEYTLGGGYETLSGDIVLIDSYNTTNFNTRLEIIGDGKTLYSQDLTPNNLPIRGVGVNVSGVQTLRISLRDTVAVSGGTSFGLINFRLTGQTQPQATVLNPLSIVSVEKGNRQARSDLGPAGGYVGDTFYWNVNATGGSGQYNYRYVLLDGFGEKVIYDTGFISSNVFEYQTAEANKWTMYIEVKDINTGETITKGGDIVFLFSAKEYVRQLTVHAITPSNGSPTVGDTVAWTCEWSGGNPPYTVDFYIGQEGQNGIETVHSASDKTNGTSISMSYTTKRSGYIEVVFIVTSADGQEHKARGSTLTVQDKQKEESTQSGGIVPLKAYNRSGNNTTTYEADFQTRAGSIYGSDLCTILEIDQNFIKVEYPVSGGTKTKYSPVSDFFCSKNVTLTSITKSANAYRRSTGSETIGKVDTNDTTVYAFGTENGRTQIAYNVTGTSTWKLGWVDSSAVRYASADVPQSQPNSNNSDIYLTQGATRECTLVSATMMLRSYASSRGIDYSSITLDNIRSIAWISKEGLRNGFSYNNWYVENSDAIGRSSDKKQFLINELSTHPEGFVVYNSKKPHAVFLQYYDTATDTFYVADPANSAQLIKLADSTALPGSTQDEKINRFTSIWHIVK